MSKVREKGDRVPSRSPDIASRVAPLLTDLRALIEDARQRVATSVNAEMVLLNWRMGERIRREILGQERGDYGKGIVATLSQQLTTEFGHGFSRSALYRMMRFAEVFPDGQIVSTLSRQLGWSHFVEIIALDDPLKRDFYAEICRLERWSVRTLRAKVQGMLYERTALSKKPEALIRQELDELRDSDRLTPDLVFRDPYFLDFLDLAETYTRP